MENKNVDHVEGKNEKVLGRSKTVKESCAIKNPVLRVDDETKAKTRKLIASARKIDPRIKLLESDIAKIALNLVTEADIENAIVSRRQGTRKTDALRDLWLKKNPRKSVDDFAEFQCTPGWSDFVRESQFLFSSQTQKRAV